MWLCTPFMHSNSAAAATPVIAAVCVPPLPHVQCCLVPQCCHTAHACLRPACRGVVHRDLKLDNLLLVRPSDTSRIKIADFG